MTSEEQIAAVVAALRASPKYGALADAALVRIASWAVARQGSTGDAIKAAKRKLHQAHGAYFDRRRLAMVDRGLAALAEASPERARAVCRDILRAHASTAERLAILDTFYDRIFSITGTPERLLDLGCGLNPFALSWMKLPRDAHYTAYEVDTRLVARIDRFLSYAGQPHTAAAVDLLTPPAAREADVALLLKTAPCLNQQEAGALERVFRWVKAEWVVVSFPVSSLGGRNVGMRDHYSGVIARSGLPAPFAAIDCESELAFVFQN